ncbi:nitroreductase [Fructilactobacillus sp. Tb1]|uniref:nitroreductase n=1 Tax=Fructilactobacillus sp. Tb1 TaxID=3422304 RepID=UPI003D27CA27
MDFEKIIKTRKSIRSFKNEGISDKTLLKIIEMAKYSASWVNSKHIYTYVVTGEKLKELKKMHYKNAMKHAEYNSDIKYAHLNDFPNNEQHNMKKWLDERNNFLSKFENNDWNEKSNHLFNAPVVVYLAVEKPRNDWMMYDLGAYGDSIMLAAKNLGIDSITAYTFATFAPELHKILDIPKNQEIVVGIGLGYRDNDVINDFIASNDGFDKLVKIIK